MQGRVAERLTSLGFNTPALLGGASWEELLHAWSSEEGSNIDLKGPSQGRLVVKFWHAAASKEFRRLIDGPSELESRHSTPPPRELSMLAESVARLAKRSRKRSRLEFNDSQGSSDEEEPRLDLHTILTQRDPPKGMYSVLPSHFFGDAKKLSWLQRRARERADPGVPVLATATFEQWAPSWVGEGLPAQAKSALLRDRLRGASTGGLARLLNSILVYWLSHLILDQFHLGHLFAHILLLLRMAEEHSTNYVERYEQLFSASLLERVKAGERFSLGDALARRDRDVLYRIDVTAPRAGKTSTPPSKPPLPRAPRATPAAPPAVPRAARTPAAGRSAPNGSSRQSPRKPVCFAHHPAEGKTCSDAACLHEKEHLDTKNPDELLRWDRARAAFLRAMPPTPSGRKD